MVLAKHLTYDLLVESLVLLHAEMLLGSGDTYDDHVNDNLHQIGMAKTLTFVNVVVLLTSWSGLILIHCDGLRSFESFMADICTVGR